MIQMFGTVRYVIPGFAQDRWDSGEVKQKADSLRENRQRYRKEILQSWREKKKRWEERSQERARKGRGGSEGQGG